MRITKTTHINRATGQVAGYYGEDTGWLPIGILQPEVTNHVPEQPKSKWVRHLEERGRKAAASRANA
jgi:hypothetical protein